MNSSPVLHGSSMLAARRCHVTRLVDARASRIDASPNEDLTQDESGDHSPHRNQNIAKGTPSSKRPKPCDAGMARSRTHDKAPPSHYAAGSTPRSPVRLRDIPQHRPLPPRRRTKGRPMGHAHAGAIAMRSAQPDFYVSCDGS
jgi:hypothetical protein